MQRKCAGVHINADRSHYETSHNGLERAGLVFAKEGEKPPFVWVDGILHKEDALDHLPYQRFNKIPGMDFICYKSTLFRSLNEMRAQYPHLFDVYPRTFLLPREFLEFQREHKAICGKDLVAPSWVIKPRNSCCGKGISICQSVADVKSIDYESVAQLYIHPFLIDGHKFDFRMYLLIASLEPLTVFIYKEGIARFCTVVYEPPSKANRDKKFMHLTNTAINIENSDEPPSAFTKLASEVLGDIAKRDKRGAKLWQKICEASRAVIIGIYGSVLHNLPRKCDQRQAKPDLLAKRREREPLVPSCAFESAVSKEGVGDEQKPETPTITDRLTPVARPISAVKRPTRGIQGDTLKKQMNIVMAPNRSPRQPFLKVTKMFEAPNPIVVGSSVNCQMPPLHAPFVSKKLLARSSARRSVSLSPDRSRLPKLGQSIATDIAEQEDDEMQPLPPLGKVTTDQFKVEEQINDVAIPEAVCEKEAEDDNAKNSEDESAVKEKQPVPEMTTHNEDSVAEDKFENVVRETEESVVTLDEEQKMSDGNRQENDDVIKETEKTAVSDQREETKDGEEGDAKEEDQKQEQEEECPYKPLKLTKRYFHILGIDIMIDSNMNPQVLELNDRPSLGVTVEFEQDLKESVISDAFEHVMPDGGVRGDSPETSRWVQIYPLPPNEAKNSPWPDIVKRILNPNLPAKEPAKQAQVIAIPSHRLKPEKKKKKKRARRHSNVS